MKFDKNKPFQTRDGRPARLLGELVGGGNRPLVVAVDYSPAFGEALRRYTENGEFLESGLPARFDLINIPERVKVTRWYNVYPDRITTYASREMADRNATTDRIACVQHTLDIEVGQGL